jgi:hypothetical protein
LPVPDLVAGVAGVREDHPDGAFRPGEPGALRAAFAVVARRAGDAIGGEAFGDDVEAVARAELAVDASHDWGGVRVGDQAVQPAARSGSDAPAPPASQPPREGCHRRPAGDGVVQTHNLGQDVSVAASDFAPEVECRSRYRATDIGLIANT